MVETLDHDTQYLENGISNCLVFGHVLILKELVAVVGNQAASGEMTQKTITIPIECNLL